MPATPNAHGSTGDDEATPPASAPRTLQDLREALAGIEHERWADWQSYLHSKCDRFGPYKTTVSADGQAPYRYADGNALIIPSDLVAQWERQIATPYAELSRPEQESDLEQVDRYWPLIVEFVGQWIGNIGVEDNAAGSLAARWREEMGAK